ncbi:MAG: glycosyltransferase family 4 protein [Methylobacter sp.]|uniref:glycosyltransferase family 4 protein n=1 Tax=Methylobacter sp. TaxID=2051955 RepID=UPI0027306571|nr:glycosyltransferase family 4 protein [Methylobacter sp.]MDP1663603.1 glycosyltransferase family 4 protein [Methylobacter sp.]
MRIAVLWTGLSGYLNACLKSLAATEGVELFVVNMYSVKEAPFAEAIFSWIENRYQWADEVDIGELIPRLEQFQPDVILCANWHKKGYRKTLKHFKGRSVRIFTSDRPWLGTPKQWLGVITSRLYLHPICEAIFVAGERQAIFARKMGFKQQNILRGLLSCDHEKFSAIYYERKKLLSEPRTFVYVGRFSPEKGLDVLVQAYGLYRSMCADPWPLKCYGDGPLSGLLEDVNGIERKGFCQPDDLPNQFMEANCLILPSTYDGWAIVVHEAAAAGMGLIVSDAVGASVHLVQDGYNGYIVETGDVDELAQAMLCYASLSRNERKKMGENGYRMSLQFTPEQWTNTLVWKSKLMLATLRGND